MVSTAFADKVKRNVGRNFDRSLAQYQAFEERYHFFEALCLELAKWIDVKTGASVLDVGCGNGISARALHDRYACRVRGVDLSPEMIAAGKAACEGKAIQLLVGDAERLAELFAAQSFDYVLYNASIFIMPDVERTLAQAAACLRSGGKIAFSFYPRLVGPKDQDLMAEAFARIDEPQPRARVITDYAKACRALNHHCRSVAHHRFRQPLDIRFLKDFFSIPAQSASLFPGHDYRVRREKVASLFSAMDDFKDRGTIVWRLAQGTCR